MELLEMPTLLERFLAHNAGAPRTDLGRCPVRRSCTPHRPHCSVRYRQVLLFGRILRQ
ncbi:MAG: hypothetical protein HY267_05925 [Deltaproteobacteria bacterium]|nr:hypothetical protein [Deltaproteobacteria bacterium]